MKRKLLLIFMVIFAAFFGGTAMADNVTLQEWGFYLDGSFFDNQLAVPNTPADLPAWVDYSAFDWDSGLGTIQMKVSGIGSHTIIAFFDQEITSGTNPADNERGAYAGSSGAGQSWEIDDPGYSSDPGDIYSNVLSGVLDNSNLWPWPGDVSWAMGQTFTLGANELGILSFIIGDGQPGGFYLSQYDPSAAGGQGQTIYMQSTFRTENTGVPGVVPEPTTLILLGTGLGVISIFRLRHRR
jgi:hypothetical protein